MESLISALVDSDCLFLVGWLLVLALAYFFSFSERSAIAEVPLHDPDVESKHP